MREGARATGARGFSTLELTLAMPLVVFAILLLIGLGHALISKQHAVVGGQFAAHYRRVREAAPDAAAIGRAVSGGAETVELSGGGDETLNFTVSATPRKGLIAQTYPLKATASQYQTPNVTNACVPRSKFPFIRLPRCKPPFEAFSKILNRRLVTNIIRNGAREALSPGNILSIITGIGSKKRRQNPDGAVAVVPPKDRSRNGDHGDGNNNSNNGKPDANGNPAGETDSTRIGKGYHKRKADERRESGNYDAVNSPITDKSGNPILVPRRVDLKTGQPQPGTRYQEAIPDAVNYKEGVIIDDKPAGRPIEKDRQEIIRFLEAFKRREGVYPKRIEIHRYDPNTEQPGGIETYKPEDFLPGNNN